MNHYYLISNLQTHGAYDYKGLDLDQFLAGSQVYNDADNEFAVVSTEEIDGNYTDVTKLTMEDYNAYREEYSPKPIVPVTEDKLKEITARQDATDLALIALMDSIMMG